MDKKEQISHDKYCVDDYESPFEDSIGSSLSSFSSDINLMEDEISSSSPSPSTSSSSYGPLYELSELMAQLPIKRGLSKYYQGKSQTFTSLSSVKSLEDLAKRGRPNKRKIMACESYGEELDNHIFSPKAIISKKQNYRESLLSRSKISRDRTVNKQFWDLV